MIPAVATGGRLTDGRRFFCAQAKIFSRFICSKTAHCDIIAYGILYGSGADFAAAQAPMGGFKDAIPPFFAPLRRAHGMGLYANLYGWSAATVMLGGICLSRTLTFHRGVHPHETLGGKRLTGDMPIEDAATPSVVAIPLLQHIGAPCKPLVRPGEPVLMGQKIGISDGFVSAAVHSSVSGVVKAVQTRTAAGGQRVDAVIIENNALDEWTPSLMGVRDDADPEQLLAAIREAGIVGLGGATFPTHVKLTVPKDKPIEYLILNGAECEPYLTGDHRAMVEDAAAIVDGMCLAARIVGAKRMCVGIEVNKPDAIEAMRRAAQGTGAQICPLKVKYPQGGEKQLIQVIARRQVPSGKLPMDVGCVVVNVSTAAAISRAVREGKPLIDRVVTVTGAVRKPRNLRVRIGVDIDSVIEQCGGADERVNKIVLGGPMMGLSAYNPHTPVTKGVSGILLMRESEKDAPPGNCMRCGGCVSVCPIGLMPLTLYALSRRGLYERARDEQHLMDCIECGSCAYNCPAKLPLVQSFRAAKGALRRTKG